MLVSLFLNENDSVEVIEVNRIDYEDSALTILCKKEVEYWKDYFVIKALNTYIYKIPISKVALFSCW